MSLRRDLTGMRLLVTGASQGIGRALAELAAKRKCRVIATARKIDLLETLAKPLRESGLTIEILQADVSNPTDRQLMVETAESKFGGLDILINNAGIGATGHFADSDPQVLRDIMETNFFGTTETTRLFLPMLKKGNLPVIVNISSIVGKRALPARGLYSASKFAIEGWSQAIRAELSKDGIDVLVVNPGLTQTNFSQNMLEQKAKLQLDHLRGMSAEEVAEKTLRAIERRKSNLNLTRQGRMLLLVARFCPAIIDYFAKKRVKQLFALEIEERQKQKSVSQGS